MMNCPRCNAALKTTQRQNVEIDSCPQCRGVWLDRGELDKIINRYNAFDEEEERENRQYYKQTNVPRRAGFWQQLFD